MARRQKGKGLGSFLKKLGKKHGKKLARYALKRAKEIGSGEARKAANLTLQSLPQSGGRIRARRRKQRGGFIGKLGPIALKILAGGLGNI